jgi:hypothetical protein
MSAIGTSYKLGNTSLLMPVEYRNFTVHGKPKKLKFIENGVDKLNTTTNFRQASYAAIHTDYVDRLDSSSNNREYNESGYDSTKPMEELSSYVGISGLGLTLGLKYSL